MFLERPGYEQNAKGWIEVIAGSMFSGKTEELLRRLRRAKYARQRIEIYKPGVDTRYSETNVVSHDDNSFPSTPVSVSSNILLLTGEVDVVGIDEAQFFDNGLAEVCNELANRGIRVIVAGLDMDYLGRPFGPMPDIMAIAEYVTKVHAICVQCGDLAQNSFRMSESESLVLLGETDSYMPLCRKCYNEAIKKH